MKSGTPKIIIRYTLFGFVFGIVNAVLLKYINLEYDSLWISLILSLILGLVLGLAVGLTWVLVSFLMKKRNAKLFSDNPHKGNTSVADSEIGEN